MLSKILDRNGFTLVELMIVVAIIGILAGIAVPSYLGMQKKAKLRAVMEAASSLKSEVQNWMMVVDEQEDFIVDFDGDGDVDAADNAARPASIADIGAAWDDANGPLGANFKSPFDNSKPLYNTNAVAGDGQIALVCGGTTCVISSYTNLVADGAIDVDEVSIW